MDVRVDIVPVEYVLQRIRQIKSNYRITMEDLARIMGYKRAALHRVIKEGKLPSTVSLYRLSEHFGVSMSYWFPASVEVCPIPLPEKNSLEKPCADAAPLTKKIVGAIGKLSAVDKTDLLTLVEKNPESLRYLLDLLRTLSEVETVTKDRLIKAVKALVEQKVRPAP